MKKQKKDAENGEEEDVDGDVDDEEVEGEEEDEEDELPEEEDLDEGEGKYVIMNLGKFYPRDMATWKSRYYEWINLKSLFE